MGILLKGGSGTDASEEHQCKGDSVLVQIWGTWDGATATIKVANELNVPLTAHQDGAKTADFHGKMEVAPGVRLQVALSGGGGSESLNVSIVDRGRV